MGWRINFPDKMIIFQNHLRFESLGVGWLVNLTWSKLPNSISYTNDFSYRCSFVRGKTCSLFSSSTLSFDDSAGNGEDFGGNAQVEISN